MCDRLVGGPEFGSISLQGTGFKLLVPRGDELGFPTSPEVGQRRVRVIRQPARRFRVFIRKSGDLLGSIVRAPSGGSSSLKPSIAVLPLTNMSGDHAQEDFADRMFEEIIL